MMMTLDTSRTEQLIGTEGVRKLKDAHVCVFGVGGVGGFAVEALARAGVGALTVVDGDTVSPSNLNRQIIALQGNIGKPKAEVIRERILDINPECRVTALNLFWLPDGDGCGMDFSAFDYVADCVDTVTAKIGIICRCTEAGVPVISSMGAGNKLYPERFRISDIYSTSVCPLARVMRRELKARGIKKLPAVWSDEEPVTHTVPPGSISFVPSAAGLIMAGYIVRGLCGA